jgi:hypothetical protein
MSWVEPLLAAALELAKAGRRQAENWSAAAAETGAEPPPPPPRLGEYLLNGSATFGWRTVGVHGSREQFEEDLGLETGAVIRDFSLEGIRGDGSGWPRSWSFDALGVGDPATSISGKVEGSGARILGNYQRTHFEGGTESDIHDFDIERERASLRVEHPARAGESLHGGLQVFWEHSDSLSMLSQTVDLSFVSPVPARVDAQTLGVGGDLGWTAAGWDLALDAGTSWDQSRDRRSFALPSPLDPTTTQTEDFAGDLDGQGWTGGLRASRPLSSRLALDLGARGGTSEHDGDLSMFQSGVLLGPGDDFTRDTQADADLHSSGYSIDAGLEYELSDSVDCFTRAWSVTENEQADLDQHIVLVETGVQSVIDLADRSHFDSTLNMLEAGVEAELSPSADLTVTARAGREQVDLLETVEEVVSREFDGYLDRYGADAALTLRPATDVTWSVSGGWGVDPAHNSFSGTGFAYDDDVAFHAETSLLSRTSAGSSWTAKLSHREYESRALDTTSAIDALGVSLARSLAKDWTAQGSLTLRHLDLEAETTELLNFVQVPVTITHDVLQVLASGMLGWTVNARFAPSVSLSLALSSGDADFDTLAARIDLPYRVTDKSELGLDLQGWIVDAENSLDLEDYDALAALVYVRTSL